MAVRTSSSSFVMPLQTSHGPILIEGDSAFTPANGVTGGTGTVSDPYVIEGWDIDAASADGILVRNTTAYFMIQNVSVHSGGSSWSGIRVVNATHARVTNVASARNWFGIRFESVSNSLIDGNNVSTSGQVGIALDSPSNTTVSNNVVSDSDYRGIEANSARDLVVQGNRVMRTNRSGIELLLANRVSVSENAVSQSDQTGVSFVMSSNWTFLDNALIDNYVQVATDRADNAMIGGNDLQRGTFGLVSVASKSLTIIDNNITASADFMVYLVDSSGVAVYHNVFVDFGNVAFDNGAGTNRWDDGYPSGGNFWGDIRQSADNCSGPSQNVCPDPDGLADMPREILGDPANMDRYPLMRPFPTHLAYISFTLFGAAGSGWGFTPSTLTNPGPTITVSRGAVVTLTLNGTDGLVHNWFVDYNNNNMPDAGEPNSPTFTNQSIVFVFTPTVTGTFTYRCRFHPTTMTGSLVITTGGAPPFASFTVTPSLVNTTSPVTGNASASRTAQGSTSGLLYRWDWDNDGFEDTMWSRNPIAAYVYQADRNNTVRLFVMDPDGQVANTTEYVLVDGIPPITTVSLQGTSGTNGWNLSSVSVTLTAHDSRAGVAMTQYRIDGGAWRPYVGTFVITTEGVHTVEVQSVDLVGNVEVPHSTGVKIDTTAPQLTNLTTTAPELLNLTGPGTGTANVTLSWSGQDLGSGIARFELSVDNGSFMSVGLNRTATLSLAAGSHSIRVRAIDVAGNIATESIYVAILSSVTPSGLALDPLVVGSLVGVAILIAAVATFVVRRARRTRPPPGGAPPPENP